MPYQTVRAQPPPPFGPEFQLTSPLKEKQSPATPSDVRRLANTEANAN